MKQRTFLNLYAASAILGGLAFWPAACFSISSPPAEARAHQPESTRALDMPRASSGARAVPPSGGDLRRPTAGKPSKLAGLTLRKDGDTARSSSPSALFGRDGRPVMASAQAERSAPAPNPPLLKAGQGHSLLYEVTAYSHGCTLPRSGREPIPQRAANGRWPIADLTVAADTRIHPFGSEVLIEGIGFRRVHDRGAAIVGRRLDLFVDSCREARRFGRKWLRVFTVPAETTTFSQGSAQ